MGEKGGVGKSFVAATLIDYLLFKSIPVQPWDSDRSNPFIHRRYKAQSQLAVFSEGLHWQDAANPLLLAAAEGTVVCDTPAQVFPALSAWIQNNELIELSQDVGIRWLIVWPTDGLLESRSLLQKTLNFFGKHAEFVVVLNNGVVKNPETAWVDFEQDKRLQKTLQAHPQTQAIQFPALNGVEQVRTINREPITFTQALTYPGFDLIGRQRVKSFLRKAYGQFDQVDCFKRLQVKARKPGT